MRYRILDSCFRNPGRNYFVEDLIEECNKAIFEINRLSSGISRRQIFDDIAFMESNAGWQINLRRIRVGKRVFYRYEDLKFSINNMPLNELEISHLKSALDILSQFSGLPQFEWVHELLPKLQQGFESNDHKSIIDFDNNHYLKGIENLGTLHNSIRYKKVLKILYRPFNSNSSIEFIIHPYFLKQYNNRWFLFGYNPENDKSDWNLPLDRIERIDEIKLKYRKNSSIDWAEYFEDIIGVTKPENTRTEKVLLHFYGITGKYIESKPLHGSQKSKWLNDKTFEVTLEILINYELERLILSYADSVKVIKPDLLKETIEKRLRQAIENYKL